MLKRQWNNLSGTTEPFTVLGEGHNLTDRFKRIRIGIPDKDRSGHYWNFGTTRVGKTREMEYMIEQDIFKGYSIAAFDPKDDKEFFSKVVQTAIKAGRGDELILFSPVFPRHSVALDPLRYYYMIEELVGTITSGVEVGNQKFFYNVAYEISLILVQAILLIRKHQKRKPVFNLNDVKNLMSRNELIKLHTQIEAIDDPSAGEVAGKLHELSEYMDISDERQLSMDMQKIVDSPPDYYAKVSSSLRTSLMELTTGHIGSLIGKARENILIKRLEQGKRVIFVAQLGSLITRKAANTAGKVLISSLQAFTGRVFASDRKVDPPLCIYVDEAQDMVYYGIENFFSKGGGANVWIHGFAQSANLLYAAIGEPFANSILDNINTQQYMRVPDFETAKKGASLFGTKDKFSPIMNFDGSATARAVEDDIVKPHDLMDLRKREFYLKTYSGKYKGKTLDTSPLRLKVEFPGISVEGE